MKNNYRKINLIVIATCLVMVAFLSVGYSIMSQQLNINSDVIVRAVKDIRITALSSPTLVSGAYEQYNSSYNSDSVITNLVLPSLTSTATYTVTITNNGTANMQITDIVADTFNNDNMTYTIEGITTGTVIETSTTKDFTLTIKYKNTVTELPATTTIGSIIKLTFAEYVAPELSYVSDGMILKLEGTDAPSNNAWVDSTYNHTFSFVNDVSYIATYKYYTFGSSGYASLGSTLIPSTGDFTLETYIYAPTDVTTDQAIISQVDNATNDTGRAKIYLRNGSLSVLVNTEATGNNIYDFTTATAGTQYLLQVVRSGANLLLYLNGNLVSTNALDATSALSTGPLEIGRWNNASAQHYSGAVHAVRLYNRALTQTELANNYSVDETKYTITISSNSLYAKATANIVTSGDGLYNTETGVYLYKGNNVNNYIKFANDDNIYRVIGLFADGNAKIISTTFSDTNKMAFDTAENRPVADSTYCASSTNGCNFYATTSSVTYNNDFTWTSGTVVNDSTAKVYVDSWYESLSDAIKSKIVKHDFKQGFVAAGATYAQIKAQMTNMVYHGYAGLLTIADIVDASVTPLTTLGTNQTMSNYIVSLTNKTQQAWTMNGTTADTWDVWSISYGTNMGRKRASRIDQSNGGTTTYFYVLPAVYISSTNDVSGTGTSTDPYIIE